ncbi:hypothetical protein [Bosea sp. (in: a-proteobacteria)]|uniref:hypothetical protein n=1 Tax=Bosea sp. (in: a-proteobacteria) TaxID=1871050 RepID=UPI003526ABC0
MSEKMMGERDDHHREPHAARDAGKRARAAKGAGDRAEVGRMIKAIQVATGDSVEIAFVDQGYTGDRPKQAATEHGIEPDVIKLSEAKRGFLLPPRRWVVERSFAWATRFRRLVKD